MDDKANYSTLVFKNSAAAQQEEKVNQPIYSEVKPKQQETMAPKANEDSMVYAQVKPKATATKVQKVEIEPTTHPVEKPDEYAAADIKGEELINYSEVKLEESGNTGPEAKTAAKRPTSRLLMCLGTLCVLLVVGVIVLFATLMVLMKQQDTRIRELEAKNKMLIEENTNLTHYNQQLQVENNCTMNQIQELIKERDDLNWTLGVILTFDTFPVTEFCPNKNCQPCQKNWVLFQNKCYLFYKEKPWKIWKDSQQFCQNQFADLVVVENLQEQEFLSNHIEPYHDDDHGYWLGLRQINNNWVWVDGRNDTLGYWVTSAKTGPRPYVLLMPTDSLAIPKPPKRELTQTWDKGDDRFELRFICESKVLIKSN